MWDRKAKLLGCSLARLLGSVRDGVPVYGSGGFTSYSTEQLNDQLRGCGKEKRTVREKGQPPVTPYIAHRAQQHGEVQARRA